MGTNDQLLADAMAATVAAERAALLEELEYRLRYGDEPDEYAVPVAVSTAKVTLMCSTCGFTTDFGRIEARDAEHVRFDGAHEPGWTYEREADWDLIGNDLELIRVIAEIG